jgi:hypothetical protein
MAGRKLLSIFDFKNKKNYAMKQIANYLICLLVIFSCGTKKTTLQSGMTDLNAANLKGKVFQVRENFHKVGEACCPGGDKGDCSQITVLYNEDGYTIESVKIGVNGDTMNTSRYIYNEIGKCTGIENYSRRNLASRELNTIENGHVTGVKIVDNNGNPMNTYLFGYKNDLLTDGKILNSENKVLSTFENRYKNGKIKTEIVKDSEGNISSITRNRYNSHGDVIETIIGHPKDNSEYSLVYEYEYDREGNWTKRTQIYNDDIIKISVRDIHYYTGDQTGSL